jgi:malate synthase
MQIFNENMPTPNQMSRQRDDFNCTASDLLQVPTDTITEGGLRYNINVGILYIESWLRGNGAAAIYNLMEDAATAEISRTQVWQWIKNASKLEDGRTATYDLYRQLLPSELDKIKEYVGENAYENGKFPQAMGLFDELVKSDNFIDFLTSPAYDMID